MFVSEQSSHATVSMKISFIRSVVLGIVITCILLVGYYGLTISSEYETHDLNVENYASHSQAEQNEQPDKIINILNHEMTLEATHPDVKTAKVLPNLPKLTKAQEDSPSAEVKQIEPVASESDFEPTDGFTSFETPCCLPHTPHEWDKCFR